MKTSISRNVLHKKPNWYYSDLRSDMLEFIPKDSRKVLDIGCGEGAFGAMLKNERSCEVWGVEISEVAGAAAAKKIDRTIIGDFETNTMPLPQNYFDCIVFNDVLEHFKDPWKALCKCSQYLTDNGFIVSSIPNIRYFPVFKDYLLNCSWNYAFEGVLDETHLRFFTMNSIKRMFAECGYDIFKMEGINRIKFPWKFRIFNGLMMGKFEDVRFKQFACVVQKNICKKT